MNWRCLFGHSFKCIAVDEECQTTYTDTGTTISHIIRFLECVKCKKRACNVEWGDWVTQTTRAHSGVRKRTIRWVEFGWLPTSAIRPNNTKRTAKILKLAINNDTDGAA